MMFLSELRAANETPWAAPQTPAQSTFAPIVDFAETAQAFEIRLELPGIDPQSIELTLTNGELTIKGTKPEVHTGDVAPLLRESAAGSFERVFAFPVAVAEISAESKFGVLTVKVAKAPEAIARKIAIKVVG